METIILASASPRRKELLEQIGVTFICQPAVGEEKISSDSPETVVKELASQKASEVAAQHQDGIIIGADTVVSLEGKILGKPASRKEACRMLQMLQGRVHQVYTGVCMIKKRQGVVEESVVFSEETLVEMYPVTEKEIENYVQSGESDDKAGGYAIQGKCAVFIKGITGDYYNVVGLPVSRVYQTLQRFNKL